MVSAVSHCPLRGGKRFFYRQWCYRILHRPEWRWGVVSYTSVLAGVQLVPRVLKPTYVYIGTHYSVPMCEQSSAFDPVLTLCCVEFF